MKTKSPLLIFAGVTLTIVVFLAVVAQNKFSGSRATEDASVTIPVPNAQDDITKPSLTGVVSIPAPSQNVAGEDVSAKLESLQRIHAEESAYLDGKVLYVSRPNDMREKNSRRKIADNVDHVFGQQGTKVLLGKNMELNEETGRRVDLWVVDSLTGEEKKVADYVNEATLSPSGDMIAVDDFATGRIKLLDSNGTFVKNVGTYGGWPIFSPDEKQFAYYQLAKKTTSMFDVGSPGNVLGIAVYNLETGKETLVVSDENDGGPVAFSNDGKKLYLNSFRGTGDLSLWDVDLESLKVRQLTDRFAPPINKNPLISSNGKTMVSSSEDGIGILTFNDQGDVSSAKLIPKGTDARWLKKDEIITYRAQGKGGTYWEFISVN